MINSKRQRTRPSLRLLQHLCIWVPTLSICREVSQVSQFVVEGKFIEATQKLVEYGNREFLRSFQLRAEIKDSNNKEAHH
jgi:hypothetical protein